MKDIFDTPSKISVFLYGIIILFFVLALPLLTKDPGVFPDEVSFANIAYSFVSRESFSTFPFNRRLPMVEEVDLIIHGPIYYLLLALPLKLFGFSIDVARGSSVFWGATSLIVIFLFAQQVFRKKELSLLATFLLAIDYNFLRTARFGRMEILIILFTYLTFFFYFRNLKNPSPSKSLLLGFLLTLVMFTHFYLGLIAFLTIFSHLLISKRSNLLKEKNLFFLVLIPVLSFLLMGLYLYLSPQLLIRVITAFSHRTTPDFYSIKSIFRGDFYVKTLFLIYFLSFFLLLFTRKTDSFKLFLLIYFLITFAVIAFGSSGWYLSLLVFPSLLSLLAVADSWQFKRSSWPNYLWFVLVGILIFLNLIEQIRLNQFYKDYFYSNFSQKVSGCLGQGSKVLLMQLIPDPYFFLAEKRNDLKLAYRQFHDYEEENFSTALKKADYVVTYGFDLQALSVLEELESSNDPQKEEKAKVLLENTLLNPDLILYLKEHERNVCLVEASKYYPSIAVFKLDRKF